MFKTINKKVLLGTSIFLVGLGLLGNWFFNRVAGDVTEVLETLDESKKYAERIPISIKNGIHPKELPHSPELKVDFWKINLDKFEKGRYLGNVFLEKGKLFIYLDDPPLPLKKALQRPYFPVEEKEEFKNQSLPYPVGSLAHLKSIAEESWRWGCIAEVTYFKKKRRKR